MSGIARILLGRGAPVSGSDAKESAVLLALRALGAKVSVGHSPGNLADVDTVVVSTAIRANNPELVAAREQGLLILPRAVALAAVLAGRRSVAVAGTHGKPPPRPCSPSRCRTAVSTRPLPSAGT